RCWPSSTAWVERRSSNSISSSTPSSASCKGRTSASRVRSSATTSPPWRWPVAPSPSCASTTNSPATGTRQSTHPRSGGGCRGRGIKRLYESSQIFRLQEKPLNGATRPGRVAPFRYVSGMHKEQKMRISALIFPENQGQFMILVYAGYLILLAGLPVLFQQLQTDRAILLNRLLAR